MGDAGGFLRHSSGRSVALWTARSLFTIRTKKPGEEEGIQGGVVAQSPVQNPRFRIPVQNPAGARGHRPGGERSPGSLTIRWVHRFSLLRFQP